MIPPLQKDKLSKNRKSQASDFKMTWELWMPYSPECCSCGIPIQDIQKKSISVDCCASCWFKLVMVPLATATDAGFQPSTTWAVRASEAERRVQAAALPLGAGGRLTHSANVRAS